MGVPSLEELIAFRFGLKEAAMFLSLRNRECVYFMRSRNTISFKRILSVCTLLSRAYIHDCLSCF